MAENRKLVLIDGHSNLHKAYHAIKESLTNAKGEPTSAVYGFLAMFFRLHRELGFTHVAVVFDPPGGSFRRDLYTDYKANRPPAPDDLIQQDRRVREALRLLRVPMVMLDRLEADDVIASLARHAVTAGGEALICSSDKDLMQMVGPGIRIWREHLQKTELVDEAAVKERFGVLPSQIATYLGLVGDTSDNIPGVPGVGAKRAAALLQEHGTLEAILSAAPTLANKKIGESLVANADKARLSVDLATLRTDCVPGFRWEDFRWEYQPSQELREFYREMQFQSFLAEMGGERVAERTVDYRTITTRPELERVAEEVRAAGLASIDTETTDLDPFLADLVGISISWRKNQAVYLPIGHGGGRANLTLADVRAVIGPLLEDGTVRWVAHHWDFDYKILKRAGLPSSAPIAGDTMIAAYLLNPDRSGGSFRLKELALSLLGIQMTEIRELIGEGDDMVTMASVTVEQTSEYACQDADATLQLHHHLLAGVEQAGMRRLCDEVELPLTSVLAEMELEGVRIDAAHFRTLSNQAGGELARLEREIYDIAGEPFKINSPRQVGEILFEKLKLPAEKKGKSGAYSTDMSVLEGISHLHPLPAKLLEYRQVEKLRNTYLDPLPTMIHPRTGRLHTSFNQTVAATGRLSSSNPNLQNIPVRTKEGRAIRAGFLPREKGWRLLAADYSQIELRILAHLSGDEALCEAFHSGGDVHTLTAAKVFDMPVGMVTSEMRGQAKAINFGIIYGMSDFRLSRDLEISRADAKRFIEDYFKIYAGVHRFIEETKEKARKEGFVTTLMGRRRFVPDINSRNFNQKSLAERIAVNTPIQGTSADMIKMAMVRVARRLADDGYTARMILQVHDELIFDVPEDEVGRLAEMVKEEMAAALPLRVPVKVDVEIGSNWAEC